MRSWPVVIGIAAAAAIGWLVRETFVLAAAVGEAEIALRAAQNEPREATAAPPELDPVAYAHQALDLAAAKERIAALEALLEQQRREAALRAAAEPQPIPEGVRSCLIALQGALRGQGFQGPRFLRAARLAGGVLEDVEALDGDPEGIDVAFVQAARMTATLDRGKARFELRFFDGMRTFAGQRVALPKDGWALAFEGVDGTAIEAALPFLVRAEGVYPEVAAAVTKAATDVDPSVRREWLERLDHVLGGAGLDPVWRVNRFRGMQDGHFLVAELIAVDAKKHVVAGAHCDRCAIEIDAASGIVSLLLQSGVLRRGGLESTISAEGFRMLLPNLTPASAREAMLGMVVSK